MRKNLTALLQKGNLTPKERVLLFVHNIISETKDKKSILTEADKKALTNWQAKTRDEAREYNRFRDGWELSTKAGIEAGFIYFQTKAEHFRKNAINLELGFYPFYREHIKDLKQLKKIKPVDIKEAIEITNKQREEKLKDGLALDDAIFKLAFESLDDDLKKDILVLDDRAESDDYLEQEEIIANFFNDGDELTKEAKEKLSELISEYAIKHGGEYSIRRKLAFENNENISGFYKQHGITQYFAGLPIFEIAKKWAKEKDIKIPKEYKEYKMRREIMKLVADEQKMSEDEFLEGLFYEERLEEILDTYARDNKTTVKAILKEVCLNWLDEGLFVKEYTPLFNSDQKNTYGDYTKLTHKEVFKGWLKAKAEARQTLQKLIDKGGLKITEQTGQDRTITGESLYSFKGDYKFVKDFKKVVDEYDAELGGELLICERDNKGEPKFNSIFGKAMHTLEKHFKTTQFFKESEKDGDIFLEFKSENLEKTFKETRESLINGYAKLLAFGDIFKKLSKIYELDLTFTTDELLENVSEFIDQHNFMLGNALEDREIFDFKNHLKMKDNFYIDKAKILPNNETLEEWTKKFEDILGDDF